MMLTKRLLPDLRRQAFECILALSSMSVREPLDSRCHSKALRTTLEDRIETIAGEVAKDGMTANMLIARRLMTSRTAQITH